MVDTAAMPWMKWGPAVRPGNAFQNILMRGIKSGHAPALSDKAIDWFRKTARDYRNLNKDDLKNDARMFRTNIVPGSMYMFAYDAKHKDTLPYYDAFPVIFPVQLYSDGFLGINFHYLQPKLRAQLMDSLYTLVNDPKLTDKAKIQLSYKLLNGVSKYAPFKPCLKRYLYSQFRSRYIYVAPSTWDIALFLPLESFQGASNAKVWADSRKIINS